MIYPKQAIKCAYYILISLNLATALITSSAAIGFDFGTSGVRCCAIDTETKRIIYESTIEWTDQADYFEWRLAQLELLQGVPEDIRSRLQRICSSGTSASCLIFDVIESRVTRSPRMYNFNVITELGQMGAEVVDDISSLCPTGNAASAPTSTLPKLLAWNKEKPLMRTERLVHQADYLSYALVNPGILDENDDDDDDDDENDDDRVQFVSDWNSALKMGYDVRADAYPMWLMTLLETHGLTHHALPRVIEPGGFVGMLAPSLATQLGIPSTCQVRSGTTDSIAAFLASGASEVGEAVTSLGSTLAVKLLSDVPVESTERGVYSHRLGDQWLVGGASNVGCAILRQENFSNEELRSLSEDINPDVDSVLSYYPLCSAGERFPVNDPSLMPLLMPRPGSRSEYLKGILQGIARVEKAGYNVLEELGAPRVEHVYTAGGGSTNEVWTRMRQRLLGVPTERAANIDAAFGAALLAIRLDDKP